MPRAGTIRTGCRRFFLSQASFAQVPSRRRRAYTLIELLVTIGIIAVLLSILTPALNAVRKEAKSFKCMARMRTISFQFRMFADEGYRSSRGESAMLNTSRFDLEDYQESLYRIDEFWQVSSAESQELVRTNEPIMCPEGPVKLETYPNCDCSNGAVTPLVNVSLGFNMRMKWASLKQHSIAGEAPRFAFQEALVGSRAMDHPNAPLVMDVDGAAADLIHRNPHYTAPPIAEEDTYSDGLWWYPSFRHCGRMNVGFVGGHVLSTSSPLTEPQWDWAFQGGVRKSYEGPSKNLEL